MLPCLLLTLTAALGAAPTQAPEATLPTGEDAALTEAFLAARFVARPAGDGLRFRNDPGQLVADLDGDALLVRPFAGDWTWGLELTAYGTADDLRSVGQGAAVHAAGNRVTYDWGRGLEEWFVNDARGIEHGYTLQARPAGQAPLVLDLDVHGPLRPELTANGRDVRFLDAAGVSALTYSGLTVFDATGATIPARFEVNGDDLRLTVEDRAAVYPLTIDPMIQLAYLKASNAGNGDWFGYSIAVDGDTAVVGAPHESGGGTGVGSNGEDDSEIHSGAAYVFVRSGNTWVEQAYLKPSNTDSFDNFGHAVDIDGDFIIVGAPREDSDAAGVNGDGGNNSLKGSGAAYVFMRFGLTWGQEAYLKASHPDEDDEFGSAVAISGNLATVGAPFERSDATGINGNALDNSLKDAGAAYVFVRTGDLVGSWSPALYLKASNTDAYDVFGSAIAMDGTTIVVGAPFEDSVVANPDGVGGDEQDDSAFSAGAAYVFRLKGEIWVQDAYLKAATPESYNNFGEAVAMSGARIVVGAPRESSDATGVNGDEANDDAQYSGAAYVFRRDGNVWSREAFLKASNTTSEDRFGTAVAIDGERIAVGAPREDSNAFGINGDQASEDMTQAGAAYSFVFDGATWSQDAYLKASSPDVVDWFGEALAVSGDDVLVSTPYEDGASQGAGGDPTDNSSSGVGAVYAFDLDSDYGNWQYGPQSGANLADLNSFTAPIPNQFMTLRLSEWGQSGVALLMLSAGQANTPLLGGTLLVDPNLAFFGANHVIPVPCFGGAGDYSAYVPPQIAGHTVYAQAVMHQPAMPFGFAFTNGLGMSIVP